LNEERDNELEVVGDEVVDALGQWCVFCILSMIVWSCAELVEEYSTAMVPDGVVFGILLKKL
jgi:hypothetical protein